MKKEIEILFSLKSSKEDILKVLSSFEYKGVSKVIDTYFFDPKRDELKPDKQGRLNQCCRVRESDKGIEAAYKIDKFDGDEWLYSEEHEFGVSSFKEMSSFIKLLGLKELVCIDNTKYKYESDKYEIVFEEVIGLGNFIEIELIEEIEEENVQKEKTNIRKFVESLDIEIDEELNSGKPELMLKKCK